MTEIRSIGALGSIPEEKPKAPASFSSGNRNVACVPSHKLQPYIRPCVSCVTPRSIVCVTAYGFFTARCTFGDALRVHDHGRGHCTCASLCTNRVCSSNRFCTYTFNSYPMYHTAVKDTQLYMYRTNAHNKSTSHRIKESPRSRLIVVPPLRWLVASIRTIPPTSIAKRQPQLQHLRVVRRPKTCDWIPTRNS